MNDGADPKLHAARLERLAAEHNNGNGAGTPLAMRVQNWPTPRAEERCQYNSRDNYEALSLTVQHWLTPRTPNGGKKLDEATTLRKGMDADGIKRTVDLSNQAEYWRTPQASSPNSLQGQPNAKTRIRSEAAQEPQR